MTATAESGRAFLAVYRCLDLCTQTLLSCCGDVSRPYSPEMLEVSLLISLQFEDGTHFHLNCKKFRYNDSASFQISFLDLEFCGSFLSWRLTTLISSESKDEACFLLSTAELLWICRGNRPTRFLCLFCTSLQSVPTDTKN